MKFCIPTVGSLFELTEDFVIEINQADPNEWAFQWQFRQLAALKDFPQKRSTEKDYRQRDYEKVELTNGKFTLPKGTVLKIEELQMYTRKAKEHRWRNRKDLMTLRVISTPAEYVIDSKVFLTPTGRISKKQKQRPEIKFSLEPAMFNKLVFEFTI